jgi:uncharacterized protein DUF3152
MIDKASPASGQDLWRRWWLGVLVLVLLLIAAFLSVRAVDDKSSAAPHVVVKVTTPPPPTQEPTKAPKPTKAPTESTPDLTKLLRMPGPVPTHGSGSFQYATRTGRILGSKGSLLRFRVGVEKGSGEDVEGFADQVEDTLGDPRSWIGGGMRLQLVGAGQGYDFTVYLATRDTAGDMCLRGGTNIRIGGVPYTSCRTTGRAIINLDRWRRSATPYLAAEVPLATYRHYVVNHEVGHELGHHHEGCPDAGGPAPVMVQQTLTLRGCVPYAWPRIGDHALKGPSL